MQFFRLKNMKKILIFFVSLLFTLTASATHLDQLKEKINEAISKDYIAGVAICVGDANGIKFSHAQGMAEKGGKIPMATNTIIDVASVTKSVATTTALAILQERGEIDFDKPFNKYLPQYTPVLKNPPTIRDMALHTSGFITSPYWREPTGRAMLKTALSTPPPKAPKEMYKYSCWNFILLGLVVENIAQQPLRVFCKNEIFQPLGMNDSSLGKPIPNTQDRHARTLTTSKAGEISDPPARAIYADCRCAGNAGLFTTANDLSKFCQMILNKGKLGNVRILSERMVDEIRKTGYDNKQGTVRTFGWERSKTSIPDNFSTDMISHSGWSGQTVFIDFKNNTFAVVLTVRTGNYINAKKDRRIFAQLAKEAMLEQKK